MWENQNYLFFLFFGFDMISDIVEANFHRYG